jgi:hypothetical protein
MPSSAVSVVIGVGARESRVQGEGPPRARCLNVRPWRMVRRCIQPMSAEGHEGKYPGRRSPCAVKVACTVATGGMEKRAVGTALCPYPLGLKLERLSWSASCSHCAVSGYFRKSYQALSQGTHGSRRCPVAAPKHHFRQSVLWRSAQNARCGQSIPQVAPYDSFSILGPIPGSTAKA